MFSDFERLSLINQFKMLETLQPNGGWSSSVKILEHGFTAEYGQVAHMLSERDCQFVQETLIMFDALQQRHGKDKAKVPGDQAFPGFDGNNEAELLAYWRFLHDDREIYDYLLLANEHDLNSHHQVREIYERMLEVWRGFGHPQANLTEEQARQFMAARVHPDNRVGN